MLDNTSSTVLQINMQPGKLLAVGVFVFWAASEVVMDFKIAAELKIVSCHSE